MLLSGNFLGEVRNEGVYIGLDRSEKVMQEWNG